MRRALPLIVLLSVTACAPALRVSRATYAMNPAPAAKAIEVAELEAPPVDHVATLEVEVVIDDQRPRLRMRGGRAPAAGGGGGGTNPIDAARLPSGSTTLPEPILSTAGATIVNRTTQCNSTVVLGGTAATNTTNINAALDDPTCANKFVLLPAGSYPFNGFKIDGRNNVTLRGAGPEGGGTGTTMVLGSDYNCRGYGTIGCVINNASATDFVPTNPVNTATWSAGYAKGTTVITLSANPGAGRLIHLDQLDDACNSSADDQWPDIWNGQSEAGGADICSDEGGDAGRTGRGQTESVIVQSVSGSGPYSVTISPGLMMPNWRSGQTPQAHWGNDNPITGVGIEDLAFDASGYTGCGTEGQVDEAPDALRGFVFFNATNSWMKNVRIYKPCRDHVLLFQSTNVTIRDSYFYEGQFHKSRSYGVELFVGSRNKIENNIFQRVAAPVIINGGMANTILYNYQHDDGYDNPTSFMQGCSQHHAASVYFNLTEGDDCLAMKGDAIHGTTGFNIGLRSLFRGWYTGETQETQPVKIYALNRFWSLVGNVLGTSTYHTNYASDTVLSIYGLGSSSIDGSPAADSRVGESVFRWGNWDVVTSTNDNGANDTTGFRWCGNSSNTGWGTTCSSTSEVPTGLTKYAQTVPAAETVPDSLVYTAKPSWFGSVPWPPIGPGVSGGNISNTGGHANKIPARVCFEAGAKDGNGFLSAFDAAACY